MGFGILFLGYIFTVFDTGTLFIDSISSVFMQGFRLLGWLLVAVGSFKLSRYIKKFSYARTAAAYLFSTSLGLTVHHILKVYFNVSIHVAVGTALLMLYAIGYFIFHFYALGGLSDITAEVGLEKENKRSKSLFVITMLFCAVNLVAYTGISEQVSSLRYILFCIVTVLNSYHIYTCYMWICLPKDKELDDGKEAKEKKENGKDQK